jgi:hypothetical protein
MRHLCLGLHFIESRWRRRCGGAKLGEFEQRLDAVVLEFLVAALELRLLAQDRLAAPCGVVEVGHDLHAGPVIGHEDHVEDLATAGIGDLGCQRRPVPQVLLQAPAHQVGQLGPELDAGEQVLPPRLGRVEPDVGAEHPGHLLGDGLVDIGVELGRDLAVAAELLLLEAAHHRMRWELTPRHLV